MTDNIEVSEEILRARALASLPRHQIAAAAKRTVDECDEAVMASTIALRLAEDRLRAAHAEYEAAKEVNRQARDSLSQARQAWEQLGG